MSWARGACVPGSTAEHGWEISHGGAGSEPVGLVLVQVLQRKQQRKKPSDFFRKTSVCISLEIIQPVSSSLGHVC